MYLFAFINYIFCVFVCWLFFGTDNFIVKTLQKSILIYYMHEGLNFKLHIHIRTNQHGKYVREDIVVLLFNIKEKNDNERMICFPI